LDKFYVPENRSSIFHGRFVPLNIAICYGQEELCIGLIKVFSSHFCVC
jgi:hypothetical protein